jgi:hypothetical protein
MDSSLDLTLQHAGARPRSETIGRAVDGQVRLLLDKRVGDAVTFAFTAGAVRSA